MFTSCVENFRNSNNGKGFSPLSRTKTRPAQLWEAAFAIVQRTVGTVENVGEGITEKSFC